MASRSDKLARTLAWEGGGIRVAGTPLWIDATSPRELCVVSHAHADHVASHARTLATGVTLDLLGCRERDGAIPCQFQHPIDVGKLRIELLPSGHLPGSAQVLVHHNGLRLLYTGDLYDCDQRFSRPLVMTTCDVLLIEATYGTVRHRFPPRDVAAELLREEVQRVIDDGGVPLVLVEGSLGRAQEIMSEIAAAGHPLVVSKSIARWAATYRKLGYLIPDFLPYSGRPLRGSVLVYPMRARGLKGLSKLKGLVKIACSGQVGERTVARRLGVDVVIPFVDHPDFDGLLRVAQACRPKKILTVYGHPQKLADALCDRGYDAEPLAEASQMALEL